MAAPNGRVDPGHRRLQGDSLGESASYLLSKSVHAIESQMNVAGKLLANKFFSGAPKFSREISWLAVDNHGQNCKLSKPEHEIA